MRYGTAKPTGPFRLTIQIPYEPRCPGCAEYLQPCVVEFRDGWAWCQPCIVGELHLEPWIDVVLGGDSMRECSTVVNGLRFYTPDAVCKEALTAYDHCLHITDGIPISEVAEQPDGLNILTPAGELAIAAQSVSGDEVWNARCLAWRKEIANRDGNNRCRPQ